MSEEVLVFVGLGSNIEPRAEYLRQAVLGLSELWGAPQALSSIYETAAWGLTEQADFLNQVVCWRSERSAEQLLADCLAVEQSLGRERRERWGPRSIDLDLLFRGQDCVDLGERLQVPHPRLSQRRFVLLPLAEIAPLWLDPRSGLDMQTLLRLCEDELPVNGYGG